MKITFAHASQSPSNFNIYKTPWIFFGVSYLKSKKWEKKISKKKINLQTKIHFEAENQKKNFLKWIETQRIENRDSIHWWMSHIAGRNNAHSQFYEYLCQFFAIKKYLEENKSDILIVCENAFLIKLLSKNFSSKFKFPFFNKYFWLRDILILLFKGLFSQFKTIYSLIILNLLARLTRPKKLIKPEGNISLIHHCLINEDNSIKDGQINCMYFNGLPAWLKKKKKKVFGLPWFFRNRVSLKFLKDIRKTDCLILEDWLKIKDYFSIFKDFLKSLKTLNPKISYPGADISCLIFREKLFGMQGQGLIFWRYIPALKNWSKNLKSITAYDQYQNLMFEHPIRYIVKKLPIKSTTIGFYHSLVSKEFMAYQHLGNEWESSIKPDFIAGTGKISEELLIKQGVPKEKILPTAALRQKNLTINNKIEKRPRKQLLILLSLVTESFVETLIKVNCNNSLITKELDLKVIVRPHPLISHEYILNEVKWKNLPNGWEWSNKDLDKELKESYCSIAMDTSSVFDAIIHGSILLPLMSDLKIMENYLDVLPKNYSFTSSVTEKNLPLILKEIFVNKIEKYQDEANKIKEDFIKGINIVNSENLDAFIPKNEN